MLIQRPPTFDEITLAHATIQPHVFRTPLRTAGAWSEQYQAPIWLKLENWQPTGSFKVRGAVNFLAHLQPDETGRELVTASAGNHGMACAYAAQRLGLERLTVFVPNPTPRPKVAKLKRFPITLRFAGETYDEAHHAATEYQRETGAVFVHAYDDARTAAGAGTIGLEILADLADVDAILVPVGGGGLIAGIATAVKQRAPHVQIIGLQSEASPSLHDSLRDKVCYEEYESKPTICEGLAGGIGRIVYEVAQRVIDDEWVVPEDAIARAVAHFARDEQMVVEGSGAIGVAALEQLPTQLRGKRLALVISGGNLDAARLAMLIQQWT